MQVGVTVGRPCRFGAAVLAASVMGWSAPYALKAAPAGVPEAPVFALSLLFLALGILGSLPGGVLYALSPGKSAPGESRA